MSFRDAVNLALQGWRQGLSGAPRVAVAEKQSTALATREMIGRNPAPSNIPSTWTDYLLGPGLPIAPIGYSRDSYNAQVAETEPRSFEYVPNINAQITPRIGYGLMPFSLLKYYGESVPEVALCRRLRIAALTDFVPQIVGPDGQVVQKASIAIQRDAKGRPVYDHAGRLQKAFTGKNELEISTDLAWLTTCPQPRTRAVGVTRKFAWCETQGNNKFVKVTEDPPVAGTATALEEIQWEVTRPDRYNAWPVWLSRFMYNVIVYDAGCVYRIRDRDRRIVGGRVIDGSTIFCVVDERGESPAPPAPAYSQIIWGTPRQWYNTYQLWYRPRQMRPNAPYGITATEDALSAVQFLDEFWRWWLAEYQQGNMPRAWFKPGQGVTPEKAEEWTRAFNARTGGNYDERARAQAMPSGWEVFEVKDREWRGAEYESARNQVAMMMGIHPSELGQAPGSSGLGGKGYQEKGEQAQARIGPGPDKEYVEGLFNDILLEMAEDDPRLRDHTWQLAAPDVSIDPAAEREYRASLWTSTAIRRDEYRQMEGLDKLGGEEGEAFYSPKGAGAEDGLPAGVIPKAAPKPIEGQAGQDAIPAGDEKVEAVKLLKAEQHTGIMIAFELSQETAQRLVAMAGKLPKGSQPTPLDEFHVTLVYLGEAKDFQVGRDEVSDIMRVFALKHQAISGAIRGVARFGGDEGEGTQALVMLFDSPELPQFRQEMISALGELVPEQNHGFTAHTTLAYIPKEATVSIAALAQLDIPVTFDKVLLAWGDEHSYYPLSNSIKSASNFSLNGHTAEFEKAWNVVEIAKHCGVCPDDDDYFGAPISRETTVLMPVQGANDSEIVALRPAKLDARPAVWKPEGGEDDQLSAAIGGPQYVREEATYLLDRVLQFRLVPVAFVSEVDGERGAAIMYVRGNEPRQDVSQYAPGWLERAAALDYVIGQCDRRAHNWLTHPDDDKRPILIDNGLAFPVGSDDTAVHSAFVDGMGGRAFSAPVIAALRKCLGNAEWNDIISLVGDTAASRAKERCREIVEAGAIPAKEQ